MQEMPNLYQRYYQLAENARIQSNYQDALFNFEKAYELKQTKEVVAHLVALYYEQEDYNESLSLIQTHRSWFLSDADLFMLYAKNLAALNNYLMIALAFQELTQPIKNKCDDQIHQMLKIYELMNSYKLNQDVSKILLIADQSVKNQLAYSNIAKRILPDMFTDVCQTVLKDSRLFEPIRTEWLSFLVQLDVAKEIEFVDVYGDLQTIIPKNNETFAVFSQRCLSKYDLLCTEYQIEASLSGNLRQHLLVQLGYLYPQISEHKWDIKTLIVANFIQYDLLDESTINLNKTNLQAVNKILSDIDKKMMRTLEK
ncbi:hypothetical protein ACWOAH_10600 [Vagococcus vulneris]|uniref:Uncharacterized protein n=1 Tax=Vagococcus vulneris TaxID=1977869 RepID=A0A429ZTD8_9ENTE|nr:hypothetical protein [Vagococcus vulneris]RST96924.1 hypothetical protein CBF37_10550 [Vagococcus vulneris]